MAHEPQRADAPVPARAGLDGARALIAARRFDEAEQLLADLLTSAPDEAGAHAYLGVVRHERGDLRGARAALERAVALDPCAALALRNLGGVLGQLGDFDGAQAALLRAAALEPHDAAVHMNLGLALAALGREVEAVEHLRTAVRVDPASHTAHHALLMRLNYASHVTADEVAAAHRAYGEMAEGRCAALPRAARGGERSLRVGFVSGDLRRHSVTFFLEPLFEHLPGQGFELFAYHNSVLEDEVTVRLREHLRGYRVVDGWSDRAVAEQIERDGIDVLIDLSGHTSGNRLSVFALKPAPVQMTYLGYPNTTGLRRMDYRITDGECDPVGRTERLHTEELLRMPGGFLSYRPLKACPEPAVCPSTLGEPLTFGSFNALAKLSDDVLGMWRQLLEAAPDARLVIKHAVLSSPHASRGLQGRLDALGFARERVVLMGEIPDTASHLAAYAMLDVALDTYPYHGTTTTFEALYMGVPVVSRAGATHVSRVGASLLQRAGLGDLVAESAEEYVARALQVGRDEARRVQLRSGLRGQMERGGMLDGARIARELGEALRAAYARYLASAPVQTPELCAAADNDQGELPASLRESSAVYSLPGGFRLVGTKSDELVGYVLSEQGDWHEPELGFLRTLVRVGERVLDLGSGHGAYAVSLAARVGPSGEVFAASERALDQERLRVSAQLNGFRQLVVEGALPKRTGASALVRIAPADVPACELAGLLALCSAGDPLVMVELGREPRGAAALVEALLARGHGCYRLIPELSVLAPQPPDGELDPLLCNLFLASTARATALAERGLLGVPAPAEPPKDLSLSAYFKATPALRGLDVEAAFQGGSGARARHRAALLAFAWASRSDRPPGERVYALQRALDHALASLDDAHELSRFSTLGRVASAFGALSLAAHAADAALAVQQSGRGRLGEPCLPALARYDAYQPGDRFGQLTLSALLELRERSASHSSFSRRDDPATSERLVQLERLGFQSPELARRLALVRRWQRRRGP